VLVGGGHAHVRVIRRWIEEPLAGVRLAIVLERPEAVYSGMVPGFVAGDYEASQLEIDLVPLARRARARVLLARASWIDPVARRIELEGRPAIAYDVASLDVGSTVRGLELPGVDEHALTTRPIWSFVRRLEAHLAAAAPYAEEEPLRVAVVGGGAAGLELACTLRARLRVAGRPCAVSVLCETPEVLPGSPARVARRARREAERRGIQVRCGVRVGGVEKDAVWLEGERRRHACHLAVWATGAAAPSVVRGSPLPLDARGFVRICSTLQVVGHDDLFAAGDCAALEAHPWVPKAGVHAVRQGPVLDANLRARLQGGRLRHYRPQRDFLALLNLGERVALGAKWGRVCVGGPVWRLKDWIDRRFVRRFQVLEPGGEPAPAFARPAALEMGAGDCGGCAAKLGAASLEGALARLDPPTQDASVLLGLERADDAALLALPRGDLVLASVDGFPAFTDDPWLVARVAAVNAASDVLAKGGRPRHAQALVTLPAEDSPAVEEMLVQVLAGIRAGLDPLGVSLVGGHTALGAELFVALSISGELGRAEQALTLRGARVGERLLLSKALGTGVVLAADRQGLARGAWLQGAFASMLRPNAEAARIARECGASACTDVSGFGLAGHLGELLRASGVSATLRLEDLPALDGALALLARGLRSSAHQRNAQRRRDIAMNAAAAAKPQAELLFDPQTCGGLLFALPAERAEDALHALREAGDAGASLIGSVTRLRADSALFGVG
jgi:selenide,water dikinase